MLWYMVLHHLPPRPPYLRAMAMRRLRQAGALPVKNSCYVLPEREELLEDMQWLRREIEGQGGSAWVVRGEFIAGLDDDSIVAAFRALHRDSYVRLLRDAKAVLRRAERGPDAKLLARFRKLAREFSAVEKISYFGAPRKEEVENVMDKARRILYTPGEKPARPRGRQLRGQTWVTRRGVKVDRIASAWLVRRFIDPDCAFLFVDAQAYVHQKGHVRFDMFEGEFTHRGEQCTFEVLAAQVARGDSALRAIGEMVHDIDCKDDKFRRPETAGLAMLIDGLVVRVPADEDRLTEGFLLFDSLYAQARRRKR